jgi:hypothetical protein
MESVEGRLVGDVLVAAAFVSYAGVWVWVWVYSHEQLVHKNP